MLNIRTQVNVGEVSFSYDVASVATHTRTAVRVTPV